MHLRAPAILVAARPHGETAVIARMLTEDHGVVKMVVSAFEHVWERATDHEKFSV